MLPKPPKGWGLVPCMCSDESSRAPGSPSCLPGPLGPLGPLGPPSLGRVSAGEAGPLPSTQSPQAAGPPSSQPHGEPSSSPHECGPQGPIHLGGGTTPLQVCVQSWESRKLNWPVVHASLHHRRLHLLTQGHIWSPAQESSGGASLTLLGAMGQEPPQNLGCEPVSVSCQDLPKKPAPLQRRPAGPKGQLTSCSFYKLA